MIFTKKKNPVTPPPPFLNGCMLDRVHPFKTWVLSQHHFNPTKCELMIFITPLWSYCFPSMLPCCLWGSQTRESQEESCHSSTSIPQWLHAWQSGSISMFGCYRITYFTHAYPICCSGSKPSLREQQTNT